MLIQQIAIYFFSFLVLWYGSGLLVDTIKLLAKKIKMPPFAFSFFVLGILTSIPEISVGLNSLKEGRPEIFVGNLLGSIIVMFLLVIPVLAILSRGVKVNHYLNNRDLLVTLGIIATPAFFALDQTITNVEGYILVVLYVTLFYILRAKRGLWQRVESVLQRESRNLRHSSILKLIVGIALVLISSHFIVIQTINFAEAYNLSTFIVGLLVLSVGTNLPELSLALRSLTNKAENIALGDYLGSAAVNSMLFGVFTLLSNGEVITAAQFHITFMIIVLSLAAFYFMTRGPKSVLTRKQGFILLGCYLIFLLFEVSTTDKVDWL